MQTALDVVYQDSGGLLVFKKLSIGLLALLLAACGAPRPRHAPPQNPVEAPSTPNLSLSGRVYRIDESHSELRILVYRAGPLAHLGHNHVIINRSLHGAVNVAAGGSAFGPDAWRMDFNQPFQSRLSPGPLGLSRSPSPATD